MSRHWLALSARNSLAPFLYQTPTLSASLLNRRASSSFRSYSSESERSRSDEPAPATEGESNAQQDSNVGREKPRKSYLQRRAVSAARPRPDFSEPSRKPNMTSKPSKKPGMTPNSLRAGSMTRGERQVFSDLLQQIGGGQQEPEQAPTDHAKEETPESPSPGLPRLSNEDRSERDQISWIFDSVLKDVQNRNRNRHQNQNQEAEAQQGQATMQIPEELDAASVEHKLIRRGLKIEHSSAEISELLRLESIPMQEAVFLIVERESARTGAALQAAIDAGKGDQAVWDVCKERIFSMLDLLVTTHTAKADVDASPFAPSDPTADPEQTATLAKLLDLPPEMPAESVVSALYPRMLLSVFQLLNLHFPQSPLIGQFRTTVKSHGRTSTVLGASTGLYNEMIYFYWRGCQDLPSVISLLQEMEVTGVEPDERMCALLRAIVLQRKEDIYKHARRRMPNAPKTREPWWDLAPNRMAVKDLIGEDGWIRKLEMRVQEKEEREKEEKEKDMQWMKQEERENVKWEKGLK
ncbi:hypothetical protein N8T08_001045 [Aspergillus melleus]|uniref:Uncharacterized protein n=1 Tax=Aspergillus melleus TaxID=138277 RepID=A0ACC3BB65_9EURO|nr:hypothetical protein N8T08_001045 [Aspergillus melleus]